MLRALPLLLLSPLLMALAALALALADLLCELRWHGLARPDAAPRDEPAARPVPASASRRRASASVVIPNWNGKDLLAKYLPSVVEAHGRQSGNEIIVVDNGSTDGSAEFVRARVSAGQAAGARSEPGLRRRLERRIPRRRATTSSSC